MHVPGGEADVAGGSAALPEAAQLRPHRRQATRHPLLAVETPPSPRVPARSPRRSLTPSSPAEEAPSHWADVEAEGAERTAGPTLHADLGTQLERSAGPLAPSLALRGRAGLPLAWGGLAQEAGREACCSDCPRPRSPSPGSQLSCSPRPGTDGAEGPAESSPSAVRGQGCSTHLRLEGLWGGFCPSSSSPWVPRATHAQWLYCSQHRPFPFHPKKQRVWRHVGPAPATVAS